MAVVSILIIYPRNADCCYGDNSRFLRNAGSLQTQADIVGFGVGSDLTWSALATVNYIVSDKFSVSGGYKVLGVDYDHDGHLFDARLSGPVLGLSYRF